MIHLAHITPPPPALKSGLKLCKLMSFFANKTLLVSSSLCSGSGSSIGSPLQQSTLPAHVIVAYSASIHKCSRRKMIHLAHITPPPPALKSGLKLCKLMSFFANKTLLVSSSLCSGSSSSLCSGSTSSLCSGSTSSLCSGSSSSSICFLFFFAFFTSCRLSSLGSTLLILAKLSSWAATSSSTFLTYDTITGTLESPNCLPAAAAVAVVAVVAGQQQLVQRQQQQQQHLLSSFLLAGQQQPYLLSTPHY